MEKLKPCPFCGGEAYIAEYEPRLLRPVRNHPYSVWCNECELAFGWDSDYGGQFDTKEEAAAAWNARADTVKCGHYVTNDDGDSSCSVCGDTLLDCTQNYCPNCGARMNEPGYEVNEHGQSWCRLD